MEEIFTSIAKIKDNLLAIIAIDYGIGLISWNVYSWANSLGINSPFELQYLIAGIIPFLIIIYTVWLFKDGRKVIEQMRHKLNRKVKGPYNIARFLVLNIPIIFIILTVVLAASLKNEDDFFTVLPFILILVTFCSAIRPVDAYPFYITAKRNMNFKLLRAKIKTLRRMNNTISFGSRVYSLLIISGMLLPYYYLFIYPNIPQELGGVLPKKCVFTSSKKEIYNSSLLPILDSNISKDSFVISDTLLVYFYNDNKLILKRESWDENVYEIDRKNINAIIWIDE